jgi:hypothetical protein
LIFRNVVKLSCHDFLIKGAKQYVKVKPKVVHEQQAQGDPNISPCSYLSELIKKNKDKTCKHMYTNVEYTLFQAKSDKPKN